MTSLLPSLLLCLLLSHHSDAFSEQKFCSCNGVTGPEGQGECRTTIGRRYPKYWCYVNQGECSDEQGSSTDIRLFWSKAACRGQETSCPRDRPGTVPGSYSCSLSQTCHYGKDCCCGKCHSEYIVQCERGQWSTVNTHACQGGCQGECQPGYQIHSGDNDCCDIAFAPGQRGGRCCHTPFQDDISCSSGPPPPPCQPGYQIHSGDNDCCDIAFAPGQRGGRCCHTPFQDDISCNSGPPPPPNCLDGYQIFHGDAHCCDYQDVRGRGRCCHEPDTNDIYCT